MDRKLEYLKKQVSSFKVDNCCWVAPLKLGVSAIGYLNLIMASSAHPLRDYSHEIMYVPILVGCYHRFRNVLCLVATGNDGFSPTIKKIQEVVVEEASTSLCILSYATEEALSVVLIIGMYRNDSTLLRFYLKYAVAVVVLSVAIYSVVLIAMDIFLKTAMVFGIIFQVYIILLVRSVIITLDNEKRLEATSNGDVTPSEVDSKRKLEESPENNVNKEPSPEETV